MTGVQTCALPICLGGFERSIKGKESELFALRTSVSLLQFLEPPLAGLRNPLGYRHINIDSHGDMGEFEYLLLSAHPYYIAEKSIAISYDPS